MSSCHGDAAFTSLRLCSSRIERTLRFAIECDLKTRWGLYHHPMIAAAIMGWFRKRSADIVPTLPDREGWVSKTVDSATAWLNDPKKTWTNGLDIAETCANILEAAEITSMRTLPTLEVYQLREGSEDFEALAGLLDRLTKLLATHRIPKSQWQ